MLVIALADSRSDSVEIGVAPPTVVNLHSALTPVVVLDALGDAAEGCPEPSREARPPAPRTSQLV